MTEKEIHERLLESARTEIEQWRRANKLTELEQMSYYNPVVSGIARAALFLLETKDYWKFCDEIRDMGGNI